MCFSTTASLVSGTALVAGGSYFLLKQKPLDRSHLLSAIPLLFGIQQISEGFVWAGVNQQVSPQVQIVFAHLFSFMATSLWPSYMPIAAYFLSLIHI